MINYLSQVLYILGPHQHKLIVLLFSFFIVSAMEVFGIGMIGPFVSLATNPDLIEKHDILASIFSHTGIASKHLFIALVGLSIIIIFTLKSFILWWTRTEIYGFGTQQQVFLRERLMHAYLDAPYTFHLGKNSSDIINNILGETSKFSYRVLNPLLELTANVFIVVFLAILLTLTSWTTILSLLVLLLPLVFLFGKFKSSLARWGKESTQANQAIIRVINHGLGGVKETRVIGCSDYFEEQLVEEAVRFSNAQKAFFAFNVTPRIVVETLLVIFVVGITSSFLFFNKDVADLTSLLSIFAIASLRLVPAISQIANGAGALRNMSYTVQLLNNDLKEIQSLEKKVEKSSDTHKDIHNHKEDFMVKKEKINFKNDIILDHLWYTYPHSSSPALQDISLNIFQGESIALIGKSGAGKTTLVDMLLGLLTPQKGDIRVDGQSIYPSLRSWQNSIGYIPQSIFLIEDTIARNIAFGVPDELVDMARLEQAIHAAQLQDFIEQLPDGTQTMVGERGARLSGGQRQRIGIARVLYHERDILVLDEATAALDTETESLVTEAIQALSGKKTLIIIAHRLSTIQDCDRIYVLDKGTIRESGSPAEILDNKAHI